MPLLDDENEPQASPVNSPVLQDQHSTRDLQAILDKYEEERRKALADAQLKVPQDQSIRNFLYNNRDKIDDDKLKAIMEINKAEHIAMHAKGNYSPLQFNKNNPTPLQIKDSEGNPLHKLNYKVLQELLIADVPKQVDKGSMHLSLALQDANGNNIAADKAVFFEVSYASDGKLSSINHPEPLSFEGTPPNEQCKFKVEGVDYYLKVDKATLDGLHTQLALNHSQHHSASPPALDVLVSNTPPSPPMITEAEIPQVPTAPAKHYWRKGIVSKQDDSHYAEIKELPIAVIGEAVQTVISSSSPLARSSMALIEPHNAILESISEDFDLPLSIEPLAQATKKVSQSISNILPSKKEIAVVPTTSTPVQEALSQPKPAPTKVVDTKESELAKVQREKRERIEKRNWVEPKYESHKASPGAGKGNISLGNHSRSQFKSSADTQVDPNNHKQFTKFNPREYSAKIQPKPSQVTSGHVKVVKPQLPSEYER